MYFLKELWWKTLQKMNTDSMRFKVGNSYCNTRHSIKIYKETVKEQSWSMTMALRVLGLLTCKDSEIIDHM